MTSAVQGGHRLAVYRRILGCLTVGGALVLAACGKATIPAAPSPSPSPDPAITVAAAAVPGVGMVVVNGYGQTLYLLTAEQGGTLVCTTSACTQAWPTMSLPSASAAGFGGTGVQASLLGVVKGSNGTRIVTYAGWPLHTFAGDGGPGQAKGEGVVSFGGTWEVLTPAGSPVVPPPTPSPTPSPSLSRRLSPVLSPSPARPTPAATKAKATAPASPTVPVPPATVPSPVVVPSPTHASPLPVPTYSYRY
jgi:predicted lipoprotein with Yx(FWY)xxD motif